MKRFNTLLKTSLMLLLIAGVILVAASCDMISGLIGGHTHSLVKVDKINATCTEAGQEAYYTCSGCDEIFSDADGENQLEAPKAIAPLGHKIIGVIGSEPTCTEAGVADSYKCSECNKLFADAKGEKEIEAADTVPALGHTLVHVEAKAVSCTENGNKEYWGCSVCSKIFADEAATTETTVADQTIISSGHSISKTEAKDATCTEDGNIAYWSCSVCNKVYADEACKSEISAAEVVVSAKGHSYSEELVIEGAVTNYEPGESFNTTNLIVKLDCSACDHAVVVTEYSIDKIDNLQPEDGEIMISYQQDGKVYSASIKIVVKHEHTTGSLVTAVEPTCTEAGSVAYYECTVCKAKFEDQEATKPIENIVVAAKGHSGVKTDAKASTCTSEGNNEYWTCSVCDCVFADEACTVATTVAEQTLPVAEHETEVKSDANGHWTECKNCDTYKTESESHSGIAYPDAAPVCTVCGTEFGEASWDGWVLFRPGIVEVVNGSITSASHVTVNGVMASQYVFGAASAGSENTIWTMSDKHNYKDGKYQVRIPTVGSNERYVYLYVSNDGDTAISFRIYSENYGDKGGVDVTLGAGESGYFKYSVHTGTTVGSNVNIKLLSDLESETTVTIYGYWHIDESEIAELQIANRDQIKVSYMEGEKFDISNLILSTYIYVNADGGLLSDGDAELFYIANNFKVSGLENGQVLEEGSYTVTVSFGGKSVQFTVIVSSHTHAPEYVAKKNATCTEDGHEAYYICNVNNCGQLFADAEGDTPISEIPVIKAGHINSAALPGQKAVCPRCGEENGEVRDPAGWMHFLTSKYSTISAEYGIANGMPATIYTIPAGTAANSKFNLETHNDDNSGLCAANNYQVRIPLNGERKLIVYIQNLSGVDANVQFGDDNFNGSATLNVLANSYATAEFTINLSTIGPWMGLKVLNDIPAGEDLKLAVYGYMYVEENDPVVSNLKVNVPANKTVFGEGETFSSEGLILGAEWNGAGYTPLYIRSGYTTNLDGQTLAAGTYDVVVSFQGLTVTYQITVLDHSHVAVEHAGYDAIQCEKDGLETYYTCSVKGCGKFFSDADCINEIPAPVVIPMAHSNEKVVVDGKLACGNCKVLLSNWAFYNITTNVGGNSVTNGRIEAAEIDGINGTMIYIGAGTTSGSYFQLCMSSNDSDRQSVIPNLGSGAQAGELRHVIVFYKNYGTEDITINLKNDANGGNGEITIPAGGTAVSEFDIHNVGGSNWFFLDINSDVTTDVQIGAYGFIYINDSEVSEISINKAAVKTTFAVGDTFSAEGLVLDAYIPSSTPKTVYVSTGYTTNLDGVVFEEAGSYDVVVSFAGKTVTYQITVE